MPVDRPPSPSKTLTLPYHELPWEEFEELCRVVLARQPDVDSLDTELFETQGLDQYGIDALARRRDDSWVAQSCKREAKAPPAKIAEWSTDFLDHWEARWSEYPIREFILCISARVRTEAARKEIARQQERFAKFGIRYVVWHAAGLDDLLRPEPGIVGRHFPGWAERHCGVEPLPPITVRSDTRIIAFERNVSEDLERLVSAWNAGATLEARKLIDRLGRAAEYGQLDDSGQRTFRRIAVAEAFDTSGLDGASAVRRTHAGDIGRDLEALLAMDRDGPEAALRALDAGEGPFPVARAQILLGAGRFEEAAEVLAFPGDATETALRAKALAALGRRDEAMATQRLAEASAPDDAAIARIGMAVRYACCVGPAGLCEQAWPEPLPDELYRRDVAALALLREGARIAHARAGMPGQTEIERGQWQAWRLAFLSCDRAARAEAGEYARALVEDGSAHPGIVAWAIWCDLEIDRKAAARDLDRMVRNGSGGLDHLTALLFLLEAGGETDRARAVLAASVARFKRDRGFESIRSAWLRRLESSGPPDAFAAALRAAVHEGHWADLLQAVEQSPRGTFEGARRTVLAASAMARFGRFAELLALAPRLADDVATADAVEMAAHAHLAKGNWEAVVGLLGDGDAGPDPALRPRAAAMLAEARSRSGDPAAALRLRMRLKGTAADPSGMGLARSYLELGDLNAAAAAAAQIELESLRPDEAVSAISIARLANPAAARELAERALAMPRLRDDLLPGLLSLGHSLELEDRLGPLLAAAIADNRVQGSSMSVDELAGFMEERRLHAEEVNRLHRRGELPIAIFAAAVNLDTAELVLGGSCVGPSPQILAQHASRSFPCRPGPEGTVPVPSRPARLVLDLPAFLLAHRIEMLPDLKRVFGRLAIPRGLPFALAESTSRADNARAAMRTAHERVAEALRCGSAVVTDEAPRIVVGEPGEGVDITFDEFLALLDAYGDAMPAEVDDEASSVGFADVPIEALAMSRGWQAACDRFVLHLTPQQRTELERAGETFRLDAARAETLRAAAAELSNGLRRGAYEILPSRPSSELQGVARSSADESVLADLFLSQLPDDAAVLSGDRCLNGFASLETVPVVGMGAVVEWLADEGMTPSRIRSLRHRLREANVRFMACPRADILRELSRSGVRDGMVEETVELAAMRRQVARDLALEADWRLNESSGLDGQGFEWEATRHFGIDATQVLRDVWTDRTSDLATKTARADYLMAMFVTDRLDRIPLADDGAAKARWCGMAVGRLYEVAFEAGLNGIDRAIEVVNWVEARCLGRWTRGRPEYRQTVGDTLAALLDVLTNEKALSEILDRDLFPFYQRRVADIFALLPEWLQDRVLERTSVPGIESGEHLVFGGHRVAIRAFETALATAARDGAAFVTVSSDEGEREGVLGRRDLAEGRVDIVLPDRRLRLANLKLALVMADAADVDMTTSAAAAGMSASERSRFEDRMAAGVGTMAAAAAIVDGFPSLKLADAEAQLLSDSVPAVSLHPPAPQVLAMQLGWRAANLTDPTALPWYGSIAFGGGEALAPADVAAFLHVPRPLPEWVRSTVGQLPEDIRRAFVDELARLAPSVLPRAHLRRLASEVDPGREALPVPTLDECDALAALFRWTWRLTETKEEWRAITMPARLVLCWSHASQLADLFTRGGMAPAGLRAVVDEWDRPGIEAVLLPSHDVDGQMAGPDITAKAILLSLHSLAVRDPAVEQVDALLDLARSGPAGGNGSEPPLPDPFLAETTRLPDAIASVFGSFRKEPPAWMASFGEWFDPAHLEASVGAGIPWNSDDAFNSGTWCTYLHLRRRGIPEDEMDGLVDALSSDGFTRAIASDPQWTAALSLLVASVDRLPEKGRVLLAAAINRVAADRAQSVDAHLWTEHVFRFLRSPPGDGQLDRMVANVRRMAPAMLAQPSTWCSVLTVLARQLGPDASAEIWKIVLALRGA